MGAADLLTAAWRWKLSQANRKLEVAHSLACTVLEKDLENNQPMSVDQ
jgi:hypothetical protein